MNCPYCNKDMKKGFLFCNALQLQVCHCEEGKSGAPDVAISRYYISILLHSSMDRTRRLPRRFAPRNDRFGAAQCYKKVYLLVCGRKAGNRWISGPLLGMITGSSSAPEQLPCPGCWGCRRRLPWTGWLRW